MKYFALVICFSACLFTLSCKVKDKDPMVLPTDVEVGKSSIESSRNALPAVALYSDIYYLVDVGLANATSTSASRTSEVTCAAISLTGGGTGSSYPKTFKIDFGSTGCTGPDSISRKGIITAVVSGPLQNKNTEITLTFEDYSTEGYTVNGTLLVTNNGVNGSNNHVATLEITNGVITTPENKTIQTTGTFTLEWTAGALTIDDTSDDSYQITGTVSGVSQDGKSYLGVITSPLVKKSSCDWISSGQISLTIDNKPSVVNIIYGNGACDNVATANVGDLVSEQITLKP